MCVELVLLLNNHFNKKFYIREHIMFSWFSPAWSYFVVLVIMVAAVLESISTRLR